MTARRLSPTQANVLRALCHGYFAGRAKSSHKHVQALDALRVRGFVDEHDQPSDAGRAVFAQPEVVERRPGVVRLAAQLQAKNPRLTPMEAAVQAKQLCTARGARC